ncbi:MAG: hypothetical protein ACKO1O_03885, partial [Erythrobacter sp.]
MFSIASSSSCSARSSDQSLTDAPERGDACRANLVDGYLSILPEASEPLRNELAVFEAMRSLEV